MFWANIIWWFFDAGNQKLYINKLNISEKLVAKVIMEEALWYGLC